MTFERWGWAMEQVIEQISHLPESVQQEALVYLKSLVARHMQTEQAIGAGRENMAHPLARFYGCIADETFVRQPQGELIERELF